MLKCWIFWGNLCTLHSVAWNRDAQNAGFSREIPALCTACPGCEMLKMLDFLKKSLHFAQRAVLSRSVCKSASSTWRCPRDRRGTNQGVSRQNSLCLLVFLFPFKAARRRDQNHQNQHGKLHYIKSFLVRPAPIMTLHYIKYFPQKF